MKKMFFALAALVAATGVFAQSGQTNLGTDYYYLGEYDKAKMNLEQELTAQPAEANFYLGEIAFAQGDPTAAGAFYDKALAADPNYMPAKVGKVKLMMKSNPEQAADQIKTMQKDKAYKKSAAFAVALGRAYLDNGMITEAKAQVEAAKKFDLKYPQTYILSGDIAAAGQTPDVGFAAGEYEQAKSFDPSYMLSYMKLAQLYEHPNLETSMGYLKEATTQNPDYVIADAMMGRVYTTHGAYKLAIEALNRFFAKAPYSSEDIERMVRCYYFGNEDVLGIPDSARLANADKWLAEGLAKDPNNFVLNREKMYLSAEQDDPTTAMSVADNFFKLGGTDAKYIARDYITYALILDNSDQIQQAEEAYQKAIALNPDDKETYTLITDQETNRKNYGLAADIYAQSLEREQANDPDQYATDEFANLNMLGIKYYQAGTLMSVAKTPDLISALMQDNTLQQTLADSIPNLNRDSMTMSPAYFANANAQYNLHKAERCFQQMMTLSPDSYSGFVYMARTQNALYPAQAGVDNGKPKEYYGKTVDVIANRKDTDTPMSDAMKSAQLEGLDYLAYYYLMTNDFDSASKYLQQVFAIDPSNAMGTALQNAMDKATKQQQEYQRQQAAAAAAAQQ